MWFICNSQINVEMTKKRNKPEMRIEKRNNLKHQAVLKNNIKKAAAAKARAATVLSSNRKNTETMLVQLRHRAKIKMSTS